MKETVSIRVEKKVLERLRRQKVHPREPYSDVIKRLLKAVE
jgi:predicted CopG family antitoxin